MISLEETRSVSVIEPESLGLDIMREWRDFYLDILGVEPDVGRRIHVPNKVIGFDRPILIPRGLRLDQIWEFHDKIGLSKLKWWHGPLDLKINEADLQPVSQSRVIWVRDIQESADPVEDLLAEYSANDIHDLDITTMDILERLVYGIKYYLETGKILDTKSVTMCAGSHSKDGSIPCVGCDISSVTIIGCRSDVSLPTVRARRVIR